ncbi:hypothetical protein DMA11_19445 [Marinilabiliaceae bacterium JC017]|nr:hypothetical protein DMA11_19445 [Marinilabiliaceae bacterium JC017]
MRYTLTLLILGFGAIIMQAQNISKAYSSLLQKDNVLYFIFPHDGFRNHQLGSEFEYDMTYLSEKDSVTLNFSYFDEQERTITGLEFVIADKKITNSAKRIFVDNKKSKWHYRYSTKLLFNDLKDLFLQQNCPQLTLLTPKEKIMLSIKTGKWKKQAMINSKIFKLICYNQNH